MKCESLFMGKWRRNKSLTRRWQRSHLIHKYGNICFYCEKKFVSIKDITFDHYIPISKGGFDEVTIPSSHVILPRLLISRYSL